MSIIVNSTPLISLALISQLSLLPKIFGDIYLPRAVYNEVIVNGKGKSGYTQLLAIDWFQIADPVNVPLKQSIMLQLDEGEAEVITIAKDKEIPLICIDEFAGHQYASLLGLDVIGTLGILLIAKKRGYITAVKPLCDRLLNNDRFINRTLYNKVLKNAEEQ